MEREAGAEGAVRGGPGLPAAAGLLGLYSCAVFARFLLEGTGFFYWDALYTYLPPHRAAFLDLPGLSFAWSPRMALGHPLLAAGETPALYPPVVPLVLALGYERAMGLAVPLHALIAGIGALLLGRRLGLSTAASLLAAVVCAHSGYVLGHLPHPMLVWTASWLPLLLCGALDAFRGRGRIFSPLLVAATAMPLLAGSPTLLPVLAGSGAVLVAGLCLARPREAGRGLLRSGASVLLGGGLAAAGLLPILAHLGEAQRTTGLAAEAVLEVSYPLRQALTLLSPYALGRPDPGVGVDPLEYFGAPNFAEQSAYVGILTLLLAVVALAGRRGRGKVLVLVAAVLAAFVLAAGRHTPVGRFLATLPGLNSFRVFPRVLCVATLALGLLAAAGLDRLPALSAAAVRRIGVLLLAGSALASLSFGVLFAAEGPLVREAQRLVRAHVIGRPGREAPDEHYLRWPAAFLGTVRAALPRPALLLALGAAAFLVLPARRRRAALLVLVGADLATMFWTYWPPRAVPPEPRIAAPLRAAGIGTVHSPPQEWVNDRRSWAALSSMTASVHGFRSPGHNSVLASRRFEAVRGHAEGSRAPDGALVFAEAGLRVLRLLGVEALVFDARDGPVILPGAEFIAAADGTVALRVPAPRPRAWCVRRASARPAGVSVPDLVTEEVAAGEEAWIEGALPAGAPEGDPAARVRVLEESPVRLVLEVEAARPSFLVTNDAFASGWGARVDGAEAPVYPANVAQRAVAVPAGRSRVEFRYRPPGLVAGAALSLLSLVVAALAAAGRARRAPRVAQRA